ncbi:hypothetical protein BSL78_05307 [Apostichopus japonicus]|uniref:Integrase catalytic domain-containing protein n=1 Tax=Stichopus japonicus TaxID=307972 RepID=A0A2G8LC02_STIJA|nr:hypothetical protein BSL78_05307 [Apostichopus japonicus]
MASTTGYGPRHRLLFDGDEEKYELWEIKFLGHMRLQKLHKIILPSEDEVDEEKNAEAFAELVQCLDDRSLSLVIRDAKDNGRRALEILREHYLSKGKSRIISLYTELTSLKKANDESVTDYMIRAETAATSLKSSGEVISDSLLIAMVLKGLPSEFKSFSTVITQKDKVLKFSEFKVGFDTDQLDRVHEAKGLLVDCGATTHIINDESKFVRFEDNFNPSDHYIELADGSRNNNVAIKRGDAQISLVDSTGNTQTAILENALYVPSFKQNIFSVQAATEKGASVQFKPNAAELVSPEGTKFNIERNGRLYYLNNTISNKIASHTLKEWHEILGHCNVKDVLKLKDVVEGMNITGKHELDCGICIEGKMTQYRNREPDKRACSILELVHCDLAGLIEPIARDDFRYAMSFVDDYSGLIMVYFLREKSDTLRATEKFLADIAPHGSVKCIRSDQGGEFVSKAFESLLVKNHIKHEKSAPYSPHQNGTAERAWRSLFEMARCLLLQSQLPKALWTYAVMFSAYVRNRCYNSRLQKTPFELFTGQKPNISGMHVFGTICYAYIQNKKKLDARSERGIFIGYDKGSPAYLVYFPESQLIKRVRCVKFPKRADIVSSGDKSSDLASNPIDDDSLIMRNKPESVTEEEPPVQASDRRHEAVNQNVNPEHIAREQSDQESCSSQRYPRRERKSPKYLEDYNIDNDDSVNYSIHYCYRLADVPKTYQEAITCPASSDWQKAMKDEMSALRENDTFELNPLPEGRKVVGGRWVYAVKLGPNDEEQYKARYVAKGFSQLPNVDYNETFSPTARISSIER